MGTPRLSVVSCAAVGALALSLSACTVRDPYLVAPADLEQASRLSPEARQGALVPAQREEDGKHVRVRADAIDFGSEQAADGARRVFTQRKSSMVASAAVLVVFGTVLSIAGTILLITQKGDAQTAGLVMAVAAEPPMGIGSFLWPFGLQGHPAEAK